MIKGVATELGNKRQGPADASVQRGFADDADHRLNRPAIDELDKMSDARKMSFWAWPAQIGVVAYVVLNEIAGFALRPFNRWLNSLAVVARISAWIDGLPAYVVLVILAIPFAIAEPAKILALYLMGTGHVVVGLVLIVGAYLVSLLVVERLYEAGRAKLHTIPWFARLMDWLFTLRDRFLAWARETAVWQKAHALLAAAKGWFGSLRRRQA